MPDSAAELRAPESERWRIPAVAHGMASLAILSVTCASLRFFYTQGLSNLYGDGLAHMEGARRIFDSTTPGYEEIGSVWLPLYHLICAPLAQNDFLWRTGLAGGIVSSTAFALTAYLLFRLAAELNQNISAGLLAMAGVLLCPSLLYLASTPLTEPLALLWAVLVVYSMFRYSRSGTWMALIVASLAALMGTMTRYEGWNILPFAVLLVFFIRPLPWRRRLMRALAFAAIAGLGPLLWLIHNAYRYGNPLEFYNGRGSAMDIYAHQLATTGFAYPTHGNLLLSASYYVEDLKLVIGMAALSLAVLGVVAWLVGLRSERHSAVVLLFLLPLPFYFQAMAHEAIPLYVPTFFPFTHYNLRYGMAIMGAIAIFPSFLISNRLAKPLRIVLLVTFVAILGFQARSMTRAGVRELAVIQEGNLNTPCSARDQKAIIDFLRGHYDGERVLVASGRWPCVMPEAGINFRNTFGERNRASWAKMRTEPESYVKWIIRGDGDTVDDLMDAYPQAFRNYRVVDQGQFRGEGGYKIYRLPKM